MHDLRQLTAALLIGFLVACGGESGDGAAAEEGSAGSGSDGTTLDDDETAGGEHAPDESDKKDSSPGQGDEAEGEDGKSDSAPAAGEEGGACYPNSTCNEGLTCASNLCVDLGGDGEDATDTEPEPANDIVCRTVVLVNPAAGEKVNAAFCFGLAYDDDFACSFDAAQNVTFCPGAESGGYFVAWSGSAFGEIFNSDADYLADIQQGATGAFEIFWAHGATGACSVTGDVARLCVDPK